MWQWKFAQLLEDEKVTVYRLFQVLASEGVSRDALYRWTRARPEKLDLRVVGLVLTALARLTGKRYRLSDLVEFETE